MNAQEAPWLLIATVAAVVFTTRALGPTLSPRRAGPRFGRFIEGLAGGMLTSIVALALSQGGPREATAIAAAGLVAALTGRALLAMIAAAAVAAAWSRVAVG